jgi:hypothetical protein
LQVALFPKREFEKAQYEKVIALFRLLSKSALISAAIGAVINLTWIGVGINFELVFLDGVFAEMLIRNIGLALLPLYTALVFIFTVFEPIVYIVKTKQNNSAI